VTIRLAEREGSFVLTVQDDGRGLPEGVSAADATSGGATGKGMLGMRERAELLGGTFEVRTPEGGGVTVEARIPAAPRSGGTW
jgi:signal transduction histidine kinase